MNKFIPFEDLLKWRTQVDPTLKVVATNGCFDILHIGHISTLERAKKLGDILVVGLNEDSAVYMLKGVGRPFNTAAERTAIIDALECVDYVTVFPGLEAKEFYAKVRPHIHVKGGDYNLDTINQEERRVVEYFGGAVIILPIVPDKSTSALIKKVKEVD